MGNTLYFECASGIAGDMAVAAMLDLGASEEGLFETLSQLQLEGYEASTEVFYNQLIRTRRFHVALADPSHPDVPGADNFDPRDDEAHNTMASGSVHDEIHSHAHTHDHEHTHDADSHDHMHEHIHTHTHEHTHDADGHAHTHEHEHAHDADSDAHTHEHGHTHGHTHAHDHVHRNLADVTLILERLKDGRVRNLALRIFRIVAEAEASVHGKPLEEVHFHEVGAVDSIVDIVSAAYCFVNLDIEEVVLGSIHEGFGTIHCAHGDLPVPVPAVTAISERYHLPLQFIDIEGELVTPTGAAIAAVLWKGNALPSSFSIKKTGYASGHRKYKTISILRAMLISDHSAPADTRNHDGTRNDADTKNDTCTRTDITRIVRLETNIDDATGEALGFVMEQLLAQGARDVFYIPIYMKKNRPAVLLTVLCDEKDVRLMEGIIFRHTTTIGIRKSEVLRDCLERKIISVKTPYGDADVKVCRYEDETFIYPEYESIRAIIKASRLSYQEASSLIIDCCKNAKFV